MATDSSNQGLEQLTSLLEKYDVRALQLVQNYLKSHTSETQNNKATEHLSVREMLDKVHQLQHHANRVGQVNIVDHHTGSTSVLIATPTKLQYWTDNGIQPVPFPRSLSSPIKAIHAVEAFSFTDGEKKERKFFSIVADKNRYLMLEYYSPDVAYDVHYPGALLQSSINMDLNGYYLYEKDLATVTITLIDGTKKNGPTTIYRNIRDSVVIPNGIKNYQSFRARMAFDYSANDIYIADAGNGIRKVDVGQPKRTVTNLYREIPVKTPINIAIDQELRLLLILDAATRKIYGSLIDRQQSYPYFSSFQQALRLPEAVLTHGSSFTYSCWLKRGQNRSKNWKTEIPDTLFGFYIDEGDKEITLHFHAGGEPQSVTFAAPIPQTGWFHFSWIKRGSQFEVLINDWSYQFAAPERINLNRELPQTDHPILFCVPGYMATEIAVWDLGLPALYIKDNRTKWHTNMPEALTGYWHLQVSNREEKLALSEYVFQDASGHGHNVKGGHLIWELAASPLEVLLPLYSIPGNKLSQGFSVDTTQNQLYWCEVLDNGDTRLMRGSTFGHTKPVVLQQLKDPVVDLCVESGSNDAYTKLILAHARRRQVMQDAIQVVTKELEQHALDVDQGHQAVHAAHAGTQDGLVEAMSQQKELIALQNEYLNSLDEAHRAQKQKEQEVSQGRLEAISEAREKVASAHLQAAAIRRQR